MRNNYYITTTKLWKNASFIIKNIGQGKEGETIAIVCDDASYTNARVLSDLARSIGMETLLLDISSYQSIQYSDKYYALKFNPAIKAAVEAADMSITTVEQMYTSFSKFTGSQEEGDKSLTGVNRRFTVDVTGMDEWDIDENEIYTMRVRTLKLLEKFRSGKELHVRTSVGTDFTCEIGLAPDGMYPVLGIVPLYAEVAIVPSIGSVTGVAMIDGASQLQRIKYPIRPNFIGGRELDREPLRLEFNRSVVTAWGGDPVQVARLEEWMLEPGAEADRIDEVGVVTTTCKDNNKYHWLIDGTHQAGNLHIALGSNKERGKIIHAKKHIDFEMHDPVIELDGMVIYENGKYNDNYIFEKTQSGR